MKSKESVSIEGEKTFFGEDINTLQEFITDLRDRVNNARNKAKEAPSDEVLSTYLTGFVDGIATRLNRVCGK